MTNFKKGTVVLVGLISLAAWVAGCSGASSSSGSGGTDTTRTLNEFTTQTGTTVTTYAFGTTERQCSQITMDTSSCESSREALGLSGLWLDFSCNVVEGLAYKSGGSYVSTTIYSDATYVSLQTEDLPNYASNYYATSGSYDFTAYSYSVTGYFDALNQTYTPAFPDPNTIEAQDVTMYIPLNPAEASAESQTMAMGVVGVAINGVAIFDSLAAGTDNIFAEDGSFDQCGGHPDGSDMYHYHGEPFALTYDDDNLVGVMRDGFFVYGRNDNSAYASDYNSSSLINEPGSIANAYADNGLTAQGGDTTTGDTSDMYVYGGHVGVPPTGGTAIFHYHLTEWKACYDESHGTKEGDDGETDDSYNSPSGSCGGDWVDGWMLSGHGNGGVFETKPTGLDGQSPSQSTTAIRYYYGTAGGCNGCTG